MVLSVGEGRGHLLGGWIERSSRARRVPSDRGGVGGGRNYGGRDRGEEEEVGIELVGVREEVEEVGLRGVAGKGRRWDGFLSEGGGGGGGLRGSCRFSSSKEVRGGGRSSLVAFGLTDRLS